jgi:hypothetical protein
VAGVTISAEKVLKRGGQIEALELDEGEAAANTPIQAPLKLHLGAAE